MKQFLGEIRDHGRLTKQVLIWAMDAQDAIWKLEEMHSNGRPTRSFSVAHLDALETK